MQGVYFSPRSSLNPTNEAEESTVQRACLEKDGIKGNTKTCLNLRKCSHVSGSAFLGVFCASVIVLLVHNCASGRHQWVRQRMESVNFSPSGKTHARLTPPSRLVKDIQLTEPKGTNTVSVGRYQSGSSSQLCLSPPLHAAISNWLLQSEPSFDQR